MAPPGFNLGLTSLFHHPLCYYGVIFLYGLCLEGLFEYFCVLKFKIP